MNTQTELNKAHFLKFNKEFEVEMNEVEATIINQFPDNGCFYVNVLQSPGIVVGMGVGDTESEAASRACAIVYALNWNGL